MSEIIEYDGEIWQVDLFERGIPGRTAGYFIKGEDNSWMLIETGPASSLEIIFDAAKELNISYDNLKHIAVTHIHIDHAGGLGLLASYFKNAQMWVHEKGKKHMIDPSRLIEGAKAVHGLEKFNQYGDVLPVPEERINILNEGTKISLGGRILEVWEMPGHAKHHVCFFDHKTKGLFSGDAVGLYAPVLTKKLNHPVMRPATPGPDFNGELMKQDLYRLAQSDIRRIHFSHFGTSISPQIVIDIITGKLWFCLETAKKYLSEEYPFNKIQKELKERSEKELFPYLTDLDINCEVVEAELELIMDYRNTINGILNYLNYNAK